MQITNIFNSQINHLSKLFEFNISSDMHPNHIKVSHSWVVSQLDLQNLKYYIIYMTGHILETSKKQQTTMT